MLQQNSIKTRWNLHVKVAITYRKSNVLGNVHSRLGDLKHHKSKVIVCVKNNEPYNKQ
jgi:hypothetical protein